MYESIKGLEIKASMVFNLVFINNTILSWFCSLSQLLNFAF